MLHIQSGVRGEKPSGPKQTVAPRVYLYRMQSSDLSWLFTETLN